MRNILEYPVTKNEVIEKLESIKDEELTSERIGGIDALIMTYLIEFLEENKDFDQFLASREKF